MAWSGTPYPPPPSDLCALKAEIHVWKVFLDFPSVHLQGMSDVLEKGELERARGFRHRHDGDRFVMRRGLLRHILAGYLGIDPGAIGFHYNYYGKPALAEPEEDIDFSVTFSYQWALFAFAIGRKIGIDIEQVCSFTKVIPLVRQIFSKREVAILENLSETSQLEAFFRYWVCKEAYVKAKGVGLSIPLNQFEIILESGRPSHVLKSEGPTNRENCHWTVQQLAVEQGYAAALATNGLIDGLNCREWILGVKPPV